MVAYWQQLTHPCLSVNALGFEVLARGVQVCLYFVTILFRWSVEVMVSVWFMYVLEWKGQIELRWCVLTLCYLFIIVLVRLKRMPICCTCSIPLPASTHKPSAKW